MWQDYVLAIISILFSIFLIPQAYYVVRGDIRLNKFTTGFTAAGLIVMAATFITLGLQFSALSTCATALIWGIMYVYSRGRGTQHF